MLNKKYKIERGLNGSPEKHFAIGIWALSMDKQFTPKIKFNHEIKFNHK